MSRIDRLAKILLDEIKIRKQLNENISKDPKHAREMGRKLKSIVSSLNEIHKTTPIILPLHPRTKLKIKELGIELTFKGFGIDEKAVII